MKPFKFALFFLTSLLITGCLEIGLKVPLSDSSLSKIDKNLIGIWKSIQNEDNDRDISLNLYRFNDNEYLLVWKETGTQEKLRCFITNIKDLKFLNMQTIKDIKKNNRRYFFVAYKIKDNGNLLIRNPSDKYFGNFETSKELYKNVKANIGKEDFFEEDKLEFKHIKKDPPKLENPEDLEKLN